MSRFVIKTEDIVKYLLNESGYYFIKIQDSWEPAYYDAEEQVWFIRDERSDCVDFDIQDISTKRLKAPNEK